MSPFTYIEARCDECKDEIFSDLEGVEFAILRNGHLLCKACGNQKPDQVLKWFTVPKLEPPEEKPLEEIEDKEVSQEEPEEPEP